MHIFVFEFEMHVEVCIYKCECNNMCTKKFNEFDDSNFFLINKEKVHNIKRPWEMQEKVLRNWR